MEQENTIQKLDPHDGTAYYILIYLDGSYSLVTNGGIKATSECF